LALGACGSSQQSSPPANSATPIKTPRHVPASKEAATKSEGVNAITIIGTSDLHGHIEMLPLLGGYLRIVRSLDDRLVLLLDGGDLFQGTLASNLEEGAPIIKAYNLLGYDASTIGNHEFDFGPIGPDATVSHEGQDRRGALKARIAEAKFPFLSSNIYDDSTGEPIDWPNVHPSMILEKRGVKLGLIGVSTFETPHVTLAANFVGLSMKPLADRIDAQAHALRAKGAQAIIVAAHAGGHCEKFTDPLDLSSCEQHQEIMDVARALPKGSVDVIIAAHTHLGMAHQVNGIAIIESFSRGKSLGRVDLMREANGSFRVSKIFPPRSLCASGKGPSCDPGRYENREVKADAALSALAASAAEVAESLRSKEIGITLRKPMTRSRTGASPLGNLFVDLMRAAEPSADVSINNGGSLRAELPEGPLHYGALFEAMPFDNRIALVTMKGASLRRLFATNLQRDNGIVSVSGLRVRAHCDKAGSLKVTMTRQGGPKSGQLVKDEDTLVVATSDFLASGGDGLIGTPGIKPVRVRIDGGALLRDALAKQLGNRGGTLDPKDLFDKNKPRIRFAGKRPLRCDSIQ